MLALCALLVSAEPVAGEAARILVVPERDATRARVEDVYAGLRAAGLLVVDSDERAGVDLPGGAAPRLSARDTVRALLNEARARFRELELPQARAAVDSALDELLRLERPDEALDLFADALLLRANLLSALGDDPRDDLMLLARLEPGRDALHPGLYAPSLVDAYAEARASALEAPPGALEVRARVAGFSQAVISVDGVVVESARGPIRVPRGPHLLVVRARGTLPFARLIVVGEDPLIFEPFLEGGDAAAQRANLVEVARSARDDIARGAALSSLSSLCAARSVVLLEATPALFHDGKLRPLEIAPQASGREIGLAVLASLQGRTATPPVEPPPAEVPVAAIAGITTGVVLLSGAIWLSVWALLPPDPPPKPPRPVDVVCCGL